MNDMFVSLPVLPHPLKANKRYEMRWLIFCVLWLEKAVVKDWVVISGLNINTINPHHHHAQDHHVAKLQKKSAVLSSAPDDDYEAGQSNFGKNNLVTTITIRGQLSIESRSDYGAIDDHLHWQGYNQPDCTGSIKSLSNLLWRRGGPWGDSLAEDHLTPWLAGSTSCKKLITQNQTALSYITLIYLHALAAYCL